MFEDIVSLKSLLPAPFRFRPKTDFAFSLEHDSDKRIQRDDEYSDSEDEGEAGRKNRQSHRPNSSSKSSRKSNSPFVPLASSSASASAPTSAPVETDTAPLPSNVTCGAEEPLPPRSTTTTTSATNATGVEAAGSAPIEAALTETAPQAEIAAGEIAQPVGKGDEDATMQDGEGEGKDAEMPVQGTSADRMAAQ